MRYSRINENTIVLIILTLCYNVGTSGKVSLWRKQGGETMKTRLLVSILILVLAVIIIVSSCATMKSPNKMTYYRFCGVWINKDYEPEPGEVTPLAKFI
jgi:hypothetical protein